MFEEFNPGDEMPQQFHSWVIIDSITVFGLPSYFILSSILLSIRREYFAYRSDETLANIFKKLSLSCLLSKRTNLRRNWPS